VWSLLPFYQLRGANTPPRRRPECPTTLIYVYIYYGISSLPIPLTRRRYYIILLARTVIVHAHILTARAREEKSCAALTIYIVACTTPRPSYLTIKSVFRRKYIRIYIYIYINRRAEDIIRVESGGGETV